MLLRGLRRAGLPAAGIGVAFFLSPAACRGEGRMWGALPVAGGTGALAAQAGLAPGLPDWRVLYESARRRHGLWGEEVGAAPAPAAVRPGGGSVPLPLAPDIWRWLLGKDGLPDDRLAAAILEDRRASLLYRGLAALDEPTLDALASDRKALGRIYERHADTFAVFGGRFKVRGGAVAVPGGAEAVPLWEGLVAESPRTPAAFLEKLLAANGGRRAFLYDSLARLEPARQRFALGGGAAGPQLAQSFRTLVAVFDRERAWWRREGGVFARPEADAARFLGEVRLGPGGALAPPAARAFWRSVFEARSEKTREAWLGEVRDSPPADAAWLAEQVGTGDPVTRRRRLEQLLFAQRVFGEAATGALPDILAAVRGLGDARAAMLALERMGTRDPALYAAAARAARLAAWAWGGGERPQVQAGLQAALAVVERARFARTLEAAAAESLLRSLFDLRSGGEDARDRALAGWVGSALLPELERSVYGALAPGDAETTVLRALAGDRATGRETLARFEWEGLWYRADPGRAELARLERVRARQEGTGLAEALGSCAAPAEARGDGCRISAVLTSLVYAAHLGDPDGPALAGEDVSRRHDFGPEPWALPEEVSGPGVAWHVRGSLLGLERALAQLSLHRLAGDALPDAPPAISPAQRRGLAVLAVVASPGEMTDAGRDAMAGALAAGRARVAALRGGQAAVGAAARDAGLEPWRERALEWLLVHEPAALESFFSRIELLHLGGAVGERWNEWGTPDTLASGLLPRLPPARPLDDGAGRPPEPLLGERFADLGLRVAEFLAERRLPGCLAPALVATLLPDVFEEAHPLGLDDRLGLDAWVRSLPRERLDDAVAALAGRGPLQPAPLPGGAP